MSTRGWAEGCVPQRGFWEPGRRTPTRRSVAGFVRGPWGITREQGYWCLTHTPTGASVGWFSRRRWAEGFAGALDRLPIDWAGVRMETVTDAVASHAGALADLMDRFDYSEPRLTAEAAAASRRERRPRPEAAAPS